MCVIFSLEFNSIHYNPQTRLCLPFFGHIISRKSHVPQDFETTLLLPSLKTNNKKKKEKTTQQNLYKTLD